MMSNRELEIRKRLVPCPFCGGHNHLMEVEISHPFIDVQCGFCSMVMRFPACIYNEPDNKFVERFNKRVNSDNFQFTL